MKRILLFLPIALMLGTSPVTGYAKDKAHCTCTKDCMEQCESGNPPESCQCKGCDCHKKGGKCIKHKHHVKDDKTNTDKKIE